MIGSYQLTVALRRLPFLLWIFWIPCHTAISQPYESKDNYVGTWDSPTSWIPTWPVPLTVINGFDVTINGYITAHSSLSFTTNPGNLIINDTLVIKGNLTLNNNNDLIINDNGILIVRGNLTIANQTMVTVNGYLIITGDIIKVSSIYQGAFTSNDIPEKLFIGGVITSSGLTQNNPSYPALNCQAPVTSPYPNSNVSYGNMTDVANDPLYDFFQSTCTISSAGSNSPLCSGDDLQLSATGGISYSWSGPNGFTSSAQNPTVPDAVTAMTGAYTVTVTAAGGCTVQSATNVFVNALPVTPGITADGPTAFCAGGSVTLTSSAGVSYLWSNGAVTSSINVITPGNYTVRVTDANGCQSEVSDIIAVIVNALPVADAGTDITIPNGTSTTINASVTGTGPFVYSWTPSGQLVNASIEDPTTIILTTTTVYALTATSTTTSCSGMDDVTITISGGPLSSTPTAAPGTICAGDDVQLHAMASGGSGSYTYSWTSTPAGFTSAIMNPVVNPAVTTTYHVAVFDGFTTVNTQIAVTVNANPAMPTITAGGPTTFCAGGSITLTSSAGSTYLWSTGDTTPGINITETGSYTVQVTNANGCQSTSSAATIVTVHALPEIPIIVAGGPTTICAGGNVTLTSSAGSAYLWSTGETTPGIDITTPGSYSVHVTSANGCQSAASAATIVNVSALPATPVIIADGPTTFCPGGSVMLTSSAGSAYLWSTGATTQNITVTTGSIYTVRVTDANGCQSPASAPTLTFLDALPVVTITSNDTTLCLNDVRALTGNPAGGTFIIAAGPGSITGNILSATGIGTIGLVYSYTDVCANADSQSILVIERPVANPGPDQDLNHVFETRMNAELSASETGEWSLVSGTGQLSDLQSPTATVTELSMGENIFLWKVSNGVCEESAVVKITVYDLFAPSVITPNGDGKNDYFKIGESFGEASLTIFNQWGLIEYTSENYVNDWDGRKNNGEMLPEDTYFYVLESRNGSIKKGSVLIKR